MRMFGWLRGGGWRGGLRLAVGVVGGVGLILLGLAAWRGGADRARAVALIAGGELVLMAMVLDDLYPGAARWLRGALKLLAGAALLGALAAEAGAALAS